MDKDFRERIGDVTEYFDVVLFYSSYPWGDYCDSIGDTMKKREVHYKIENGCIAMWDGDGGYMPIARVINDLHCRIIVRTLQFAEECEECIDREGDFEMFQECFSSYIKETMMEWRNDV